MLNFFFFTFKIILTQQLNDRRLVGVIWVEFTATKT